MSALLNSTRSPTRPTRPLRRHPIVGAGSRGPWSGRWCRPTACAGDGYTLASTSQCRPERRSTPPPPAASPPRAGWAAMATTHASTTAGRSRPATPTNPASDRHRRAACSVAASWSAGWAAPATASARTCTSSSESPAARSTRSRTCEAADMTRRKDPAAVLLACLALVGCQDPYTQSATTPPPRARAPPGPPAARRRASTARPVRGCRGADLS